MYKNIQYHKTYGIMVSLIKYSQIYTKLKLGTACHEHAH